MSTPIVGYIQDQSYTAQADRAIQNARMKHGGTGTANDIAANNGVIMGGAANLDVNVVSGMNLKCDGGKCMVSGYTVVFPAALNRTVQPSTSYARRDLVIARVYDTENGDGYSKADIEIVKGSTTSDPVLPSGRCLILYQVNVGANASTVTLTDRRVGTAAAGGVRSTQLLPASVAGMAPGEIVHSWSSGHTAQNNVGSGSMLALARGIASGSYTEDSSGRTIGASFVPVFSDRSVVIPYAAGAVLINTSVTVRPDVASIFEMKVYWNNVVVAWNPYNAYDIDTATYTLNACVNDVPAGTYGLCFISLQVLTGSAMTMRTAQYSWAAIGS